VEAGLKAEPLAIDLRDALRRTRSLRHPVFTARFAWLASAAITLKKAYEDYPERYEAARLETKSGWALFRHVTLPMLQPTVVLVLLLRITEAFKVLDIPFTLTTGGPGTATQVLTMYAYRTGMRFFNFGYASAISVVVFLMVTGIILVLFRRIRQVYQ
jgi:multiple sugar transport system permease protein